MVRYGNEELTMRGHFAIKIWFVGLHESLLFSTAAAAVVEEEGNEHEDDNESSNDTTDYGSSWRAL
jgi:hypothetical protein